MENLSPKDVSLLFFYFLHQQRIVFFDELFLHNPDILLNKFIPDALLIHLLDIFPEIFAKNSVVISLSETFSFECSEHFFHCINLFLTHCRGLVDNWFLNLVFLAPEAVACWFLEHEKRNIVSFQHLLWFYLLFIALDNRFVKEKIHLHNEVNNQHISIDV